MKVVVCVAVMCLLVWRGSDAKGAGRALPVEAENFVIELFTGVNPHIEWDPSNFLIDLAGRFANCKRVGKSGFIKVKRNTPEGGAIVAIVDHMFDQTSKTDAPSVTNYARLVFEKWMKNPAYVEQIGKADLFGCAVRPACSGQVSISCLFTSRRNALECPTSCIQPKCIPYDGSRPIQTAIAFTKEQYDLAESLTKTSWDRSHFLEDLSGYETNCAMNGRKSWPFANARRIATEMGHKIFIRRKDTPNRGNTMDALRVILQSFKLPYVKKIGCSVIPDCGGTTNMYVVVSCVYEKK